MTTLYLIPTPPADPDDMTLRAVRLLREVSAIATPDTAATAALLAHHDLPTNHLIGLEGVLDALERGDVALVGIGDVPGVADEAGTRIVRGAITRGIRVEPIPGASLAITALVLSGLPTDSFVFVGRLPDVKMCEPLGAYISEQSTLVMTVSGGRLAAVIAALRKKFGERPACVVNRPGAGDGVVVRGTLGSIDTAGERVEGEAAIVIGGAAALDARVWEEEEVRAALRDRLAGGEALKTAAKALAAETGWDRRAIYSLGLQEK